MYTALLEGRLRLSANGEWWHEGVPFSNPNVAALFHRSIIWDGSRYLLEIGRQRATFDLDDTAYFVVALQDADVPWRVTLASGETEALDPATLALGPANEVYCRLTNGHPAKFLRSAHQALLVHADEGGGIRIGAARHVPTRR